MRFLVLICLIKGKTFFKWAGGKRDVIDELVKYSPKEKGVLLM